MNNVEFGGEREITQSFRDGVHKLLSSEAKHYGALFVH